MNVYKEKGHLALDAVCDFSEEDQLNMDNEKALAKMPWLVAKPLPSMKNFEVAGL